MISFSFFAVYIALAAVYLLFLSRIRQGLRVLQNDLDEEPAPAPGGLPHVSLIIPVRNEAPSIPALLEGVLAQRYPDESLQIILVDDHSSDGSFETAAALVNNDPRCVLLALPDGEFGKKAAIAAGIAAATGEIILTTDGDCTHPPGWVESMARRFVSGADVVAGAVVIADRSSAFARMQALEFLGLMGTGAGLFGIGYPRLCNGANFAYRRGLYSRAGGFDGNDHISSGDDEFLLHKMVYQLGARAEFNAHADAVVTTPAAGGVASFLSQRSRWASKGARYGDARFVGFLVLLFCYFLFAAVSPVIALTGSGALFAAAAMYAVKALAELRILLATAQLLGQPVRFGDFLIAELLHPFYLVIVTISGTLGFGRWKNRSLIRK